MPQDARGEQDAWVERVLQVTPRASSEQPAKSPSARLASVGQQLQALKTAGDPRVVELTRAFAAAIAASRSGDPETASLISVLETLLATGSSDTAPPPPPSSPPAPDFVGLMARWTSAQDGAVQALTAIADGLLAIEEVQLDPRFKHVEKAVKALPELLPPSGGALAAILAHPDSDASAAAQATLSAVATYRRDLAVTALARLEALAARHVRAVPVVAPLAAALDEIETTLA